MADSGSASTSSGAPSSFRRTQGAAFAVVHDASSPSAAGALGLRSGSSSARRRAVGPAASAATPEQQRESDQEEQEQQQQEDESSSPLGSPDGLTERALDEFAAQMPNASGSSSDSSFTELNTDEPYRYNCSTRMRLITTNIFTRIVPVSNTRTCTCAVLLNCFILRVLCIFVEFKV